MDSWARRRVYAAFKEALGSGMHHHLQVGGQRGRGHPRSGAMWTRAHGLLGPQNNELLRDIFGLGPVLVLDAAALKACKISRFEKVRPLSLPLYCFGLAGGAGGGAGVTAAPLTQPSLSAPPSTCTTRRPSEPGPRRAAAYGTSGRTSCEQAVRVLACVFNRRPCNTWSLPGLVAFIFLMTKPKRDTGLGWLEVTSDPPDAASSLSQGHGAGRRPCLPQALCPWDESLPVCVGGVV